MENQITHTEQEQKNIYDHPHRSEIFEAVSEFLKRNPFITGPRLTEYQIVKIAQNLSKILNTPEQALNFIGHYLQHQTADDLFSACNFQLPSQCACPELWRYLAGDKEYLKDGGFRRLLCRIAEVESALIEKKFIVNGEMQTNVRHLITLVKKRTQAPQEKMTKKNGKGAPSIHQGNDFVLLVHGLSLYTGLSVKELEEDPVLQERARLFFMNDVREEHFAWFQEKLKSAKLTEIPQHLPQVVLQGKTFNLPENWYLQSMLPTDPRFGILGKLTDCCLHPGKSEGKKILEVLLTDPRTGVYVVCKKTKKTPNDKDPIMIATYVLRASAKTMIFGACFGARHNEGSRQKIQQAYRFLTQFAQHLVEHQGLEQVYRGFKAWDIPSWYFGIATQVMKPARVLPQDILAVGTNADGVCGAPHPFIAFDFGDSDYEPRPLILVADAHLDPQLVAVRKPNIETLGQWKKEVGELNQAPINKPEILIAEAFKLGKNPLAIALFNEVVALTSPEARTEARASLIRTLLPYLVYCCSDQELKDFAEDLELEISYSGRGYELTDLKDHYADDSLSNLRAKSDKDPSILFLFPKENILLLVARYLPEKMDFFMKKLKAIDTSSQLEILEPTLKFMGSNIPPLKGVYQLIQAVQDLQTLVLEHELMERVLEHTVDADDASHFEKFSQAFSLTSQKLLKRCLNNQKGFQCLRVALRGCNEEILLSISEDLNFITNNSPVQATLLACPLHHPIWDIAVVLALHTTTAHLQENSFAELCFAEMLQMLSDASFQRFKLPEGLPERAQAYLQDIIDQVGRLRIKNQVHLESPAVQSGSTAPVLSPKPLGFSPTLKFLLNHPNAGFARSVATQCGLTTSSGTDAPLQKPKR